MNGNNKLFAHYHRLTRVEKSLLCRAFAVLTGTWLCSRVLGMSYMHRRLEPGSVKRAVRSGPGGTTTASGIIRAVNRVSRGLGVGTCLDRSLVIESMLRRRGFEAQIRLGSSGRRGEPFAHAWVEGPGIPLGAGNQPGRHGMLTRRGEARPSRPCDEAVGRS